MLATIIDLQRWFQWARCGGSESGPPPQPLDRPGVQRRKGDHRRGNATRSETNKVLGMRLDTTTDPDRDIKLQNLFRTGGRGPVRDLRKLDS